jgi:hypothetical protein
VKGNKCSLAFSPVAICETHSACHSAVNLLSVKFSACKYALSNMAPKRKICDKDTESELMCDID